MDGDSITYPADLCPRDRGPEDAPEKGCPRFVRLKGDEVVLARTIELAPFDQLLSLDCYSTEAPQMINSAEQRKP